MNKHKDPRYSIADMQVWARRRGGECLSPEYIRSDVHLRWRCENGHEWLAAPNKIKQGRWCPECARKFRADQRRAAKFIDMQRIAKERGGECLSTEFTGIHDKMLWQCAEGHQWWAMPVHVQNGTWCRTCFGLSRRTPIEAVKKLAQARGGQCLANALDKGAQSVVEFRCSEGHYWFASVSNIRNGSWCPVCGHIKGTNKRRLYSYEVIQALVTTRRGKLLSPKVAYQNLRSHLRFECHKGHVWENPASSIVSGRWCPRCSIVGRKTLDDLQALAKQHEGQCLATDYKTSAEKYRWRCKHGHEWMATYRTANNTWCRTCKNQSPRILKSSWNAYTIDTMHSIAAERGWRVLSKTYKTAMHPLRWQCEHGHEFKMKPRYVIDNAPCPICKPRKHSLAKMQQVAQERGGKCLATHYQNVNTKLRWRCKEGHEWEALPMSILKGSWCNKCRKTAINRAQLRESAVEPT